MTAQTTSISDIRYEPNERVPSVLSLSLGLQLTVVSVSATILITTIVMRAGGVSQEYLTWAVLIGVLIGGLITLLQTRRWGGFGMGHVLMMGSSSAFLGVAIDALLRGGVGMFASLVTFSALFQFLIANQLARFRVILTPIVSGTVLMLIPVSIMPYINSLLEDLPQDSPEFSAPLIAITTVVVMCVIGMKATGLFRMWAPLIAVGIGAIGAGFFGVFDFSTVHETAWIGLPPLEWQRPNLSFGPIFWSLVPGFLLAATVSTLRTLSSSVAIQRTSWRRSREVNYSDVQGAITADSVGNLLSGIAGTAPGTAYSTSVSMAQLTGVASRGIGVMAGCLFVAFAFFPKANALIQAIPGPVLAAYLFIMLSAVFMIGIQLIVQDGIDYKKCMIIGTSFWIGVGFQAGYIFPDFIAEFGGGFLSNGMTSGGMIAILMTLFLKVSQPRSRRLRIDLELSNLPDLQEFLAKYASDNNWSEDTVDRIEAIGEEVMVISTQRREIQHQRAKRRLSVSVRREGSEAILEFTAGAGLDSNIQDQVAVLGDVTDAKIHDQEVSLRILRHLAASIRHQHFNEVDIITVRVEVKSA